MLVLSLLLGLLLRSCASMGLEYCASDWDCQYEACQNSYCVMTDVGNGNWVGFCTQTIDNGIGVMIEVRCDKKPCPAGQYFYAETMCDECYSGEYTSAINLAIACDRCRPGTYQPNYGATACFECPAGKSQTGVGITKYKCQACEAGKYASAAGSGTCKVCAGLTAQDAAVVGASTCSGCPAGTSMPSGTGTCVACSAGRYNPTMGQEECSNCPQGTYQNENSATQCKLCPAGTYQTGLGYTSVSGSCGTCQAGTYTSTVGRAQCEGCWAGSYQDGVGTTGCKLCPAGKALATTGANQLAMCLACAAGKYSSSDGTSVCQDCSPGSYQKTEGGTVCVLCQPGTIHGVSGRWYGCQQCGGGSRASASGQTECILCEPGSYQTGVQGSVCVECSPGKYQNVLSSAKECENCVAGKYTATYKALGCDNCGAGTYQSSIGGSGCTNCEPGKLSTVVAAVSSVVCGACAPATFIENGKCVGCKARPGQDWFAMVTCSYERDAIWQRCTTACPAGAIQRAPCTNVSDLECQWPAGDARCSGGLTNPASSPDWLTALSPCPRGQYLYGFRSLTDKDCRLCPADTTSVNGFTCERCAGPLEEPYFLDRSLCVCRPPAVMLGEGCVCPAGWAQNGSACAMCPAGRYKARAGGGGCGKCEAGTYASSAGGTACEGCSAGLYSVGGGNASDSTGCVKCPLDGWYAPDRTQAVCVPCNRSCAGVLGWTDAGPCPGAGDGWRVCEPCSGGLPGNATWLARAAGSCIYECDSGFYRDETGGGGRCRPCSTDGCEAGQVWEDCSADADRRCDGECVNASKPLLNARWAVSGSGGRDCPWECEAGHALVRTDYWVFVLEECVAVS